MKSSSTHVLRLAIPLALALSACVAASNSGPDGTGGAGTAGSNGTAGTTGGSAGTTGGGGAPTGTGGGNGMGGMVITGGGGRVGGLGGSGQGGAPSGQGGTMANADGGSRPDLTGRKALLIVKDPASLDEGDVLIQSLLQLRGVTVTLGGFPATPASMATGFNVMILSSSIGSDSGAAIYKDVPIPVIVYYNSLYQVMGFVATSSGRGTSDDTVRVTMTDVSTQLSSDLGNGASFLMTNSALHSSSYGWGIPGGTAIKVAAVAGAPTEFAVFAYEKGAAMAVGTAAGRRVALGFKSNVVDALTVEGFKLQDGAFSWTAGAP